MLNLNSLFCQEHLTHAPQITQLEAYQTNSSRYIVGLGWEAGEENSDLTFYEVRVDGVISRVQDTKEVVVMERPPPENVSIQVTAVSQCGQRSDPASATTSVATVSAGKELGRNPLSYISSNLCASKKLV